MSNANTQIESRIMIPGRLSHCHIWEPARTSKDPNSKLAYSVAILIPKTEGALLKKIWDTIVAVYNSEKDGDLKGITLQNLSHPLRDGDKERPLDPAYKGMYFIGAKSSTQPGVLDEAKNAMLDKTKLYSGCYGIVSVNFFAYKNVQKGVGAGLGPLMKTADGVNLTGQISADEAFKNVAPIAGNQPAIVGTSGYNPFG